MVMAVGVAPPTSLLTQWVCRCYISLPSHHKNYNTSIIFCKALCYFSPFVAISYCQFDMLLVLC